MSLTPGTKLGPYEIVSPLGAGGMGEVYRARDKKLGREVAIKILPEQFAQDHQRMSRFEREAQLLAALNHPHIAHIYGFEDSDGAHALVMELVEGPTLAERIEGGPLPLEETLQIARQIAEALEYAHDRGIIHRDLKPANVKLTADGNVKILDFGLAKALADETSPTDISHSPTLTAAATQAGIVMGTAAYMSPEQAKGKSADRRADIWAFGCLFYEMLAGKMAFCEETLTDTLAAVIRDDPDWTLLPSNTPPSIRNLVARCMRKDAKQRLQSIGDARIAIDDVIAGTTDAPSGPIAPSPVNSHSPRTGLFIAIAAITLLLGTALGFSISALRNGKATSLAPVSLNIELPQAQSISALEFAPLAISADGDRIVYLGTGKNGLQLYLRQLDSFQITPISGTQGAVDPFFSPDGQWIAFTGEGKLKKVAITGGAAEVICDLFGAHSGGTWNSDGNIYLSPNVISGVFRVPATGGTPVAITHAETTEGDNWPQLLPGGKNLLLTSWNGSGFDAANIEVVELATGKRHVLIEGGSAARFVAPNFLVYARTGSLMMAHFDPDRLEVQGAPVQILSDLMTNPSTGAPQFDISSTGTLIYLSGSAEIYENNLDWIDRSGKTQPFGFKPGLYQSPRFSPDGHKLAITVRLPNPEIWIYDLDRGAFQQMTSAPGENEIPVWSPDGKQIAYASNGRKQAYVFPVDGDSPERAIADIPNHFHLQSWSPDGSLIALENYGKPGVTDIWMLPTADHHPPYLYLSNAGYPAFSPDGHWLAYVSNSSSAENVYIQRFPGPGDRIQVSSEDGDEPVWSRDGRELYYASGNTLYSVSVATAPKLAIGKPEIVFRSQLWRSNIAGPNYDVAPDGKRFLMMDSGKESELTQIHVILNWAAQLK